MRNLLPARPYPGFNRREILAALGGGLLATSRAFAAPSQEFFAQRLQQLGQAGKIDGLHALLVSQGGKLVFAHYGRGDDEAEGQGYLGTVTFAPDVPHDLRSVSKSVIGLVMALRSRPARCRHRRPGSTSSFRNTPISHAKRAATASRSTTC